MHRRMPGKMVRTAVVCTVALIFALLTGCAEGTKGIEEDLVSLTETRPEEVPEEEADRKNQTDQEEYARNTQKEQGTSEEPPRILGEETKGVRNTGIVYVHVCGEVASPGVYPLPAGSRLYEAIEAAGGILENGAGEQLNQAAQIEDGQQIYVPSREEAQQGLTGSGYNGWQESAGNELSSPKDGKVNLNIASREELMTLSGIGEAKAASIIAYREEHGGFRQIEELMEVEGIKEGVFNKVRDQIRID